MKFSMSTPIVSKPKQQPKRRRNNKRTPKPKMEIERNLSSEHRSKIIQNQEMINRKIEQLQAPALPFKYVNYMHQLMNPESYLVQCPDDVSVPTGLYKSIKNYSIAVDTLASNGQFSIVVQPKIGSGSNSDFFGSNVCVMKMSANDVGPMTTTTWNAYTDTNSAEMFSPLNMYFGLIGAGARPAGIYFSNSGFPNTPISGTPTSTWLDPDNNLTLSFKQLDRPIVLPAGVDVNGNPVPSIPITAANSNNFDLSGFNGASGWYDLTVFALNANSSALIAGSAISYYLFETDLSFNNCTGYIRSSTGALDQVAGVFVSSNRWDRFSTGLAHEFDWTPTVTAVNQQSLGSITWRVNLDYNKYYFVCTTIQQTVGTADGAFSTNFQLHSLNRTSEYTGGSLIENLRPIACSALASFVGPPAFLNGSLAMGVLPVGSLQEWIDSSAARSYSTLTSDILPNTIYTGVANKGAYGFWLPTDAESRILKPLQQHNATDFGAIVINGNINSAGGGVTATTVYALRVITVYEYTTTKRLLAPRPCIGDLATFTKVISFLSENPRVFENPLHLQSILNIAKKAISPIASAFFRKPNQNQGSKTSEINKLLAPILGATKSIPGMESIGGIADLLPMLLSMV